MDVAIAEFVVRSQDLFPVDCIFYFLDPFFYVFSAVEGFWVDVVSQGPVSPQAGNGD